MENDGKMQNDGKNKTLLENEFSREVMVVINSHRTVADSHKFVEQKGLILFISASSYLAVLFSILPSVSAICPNGMMLGAVSGAW